MNLPADDTRQGLEEITTGLDRVRTSLAGFFTNATLAVEERSAHAAVAEARAIDAERRTEQAEQRARLAHEARRAMAAQLDDVKRALIDTGAIDEDDPYGHADLPDVIRQAMADRDPAYALAEQERARQVERALTAEIRHAERTEQRAEEAERRADGLSKLLATAEQDAERYQDDYLAAARTIADMHEAATGRTGMGPVRGVVEDVADMRAHAEQGDALAVRLAQRTAAAWQRRAKEAQADRDMMEDSRDSAIQAREQAQQDAKQAKEREAMANERAERHRATREQWVGLANTAAKKASDRARTAEATIDRVRALLDTHLGPLATTAVRNALDTPEG
ncbi:hypothetical protein OG909_12150 [Streptomyces sp. NBC_01754]|uniref:hypothetical protein n=1 Tax=Streptomyces sp. NBC_01754 TaxID=2975930 RepID=UPI002DDA1966|nr:hypothetical protein [Streptomyces sp. NBC_01754]WSC92986.1 hypothetical protein OG909_12150 [Streptomyces sp. NBC_01754]